MIDLSTLKYGDKVMCRNRIGGGIFVAVHPKNSVVGIFIDSTGEVFTARGIELAPKKHKLVGFINVYSKTSNGVFYNKEQADGLASPRRSACIDLSKYDIEYEEGEEL